jgi:hypothetical protein
MLLTNAGLLVLNISFMMFPKIVQSQLVIRHTPLCIVTSWYTMNGRCVRFFGISASTFLFLFIINGERKTHPCLSFIFFYVVIFFDLGIAPLIVGMCVKRDLVVLPVSSGQSRQKNLHACSYHFASNSLCFWQNHYCCCFGARPIHILGTLPVSSNLVFRQQPSHITSKYLFKARPIVPSRSYPRGSPAVTLAMLVRTFISCKNARTHRFQHEPPAIGRRGSGRRLDFEQYLISE